jgi:hypothetical protein
MVLDGFFRKDLAQAEEYRRALKPLLVDSSHMANYSRQATETKHAEENVLETSQDLHKSRSSIPKLLPPEQMLLVPELFIVPRNRVNAEKAEPGSQQRVPNGNVPLVWAQSLYTIGNLLGEGLLAPAELDPLGRRFVPTHGRNKINTVVQVVLVAESVDLQMRLSTFGLDTQTREQVRNTDSDMVPYFEIYLTITRFCMQCEPITISAPSALRDAYITLGANPKLVRTAIEPPSRAIDTKFGTVPVGI